MIDAEGKFILPGLWDSQVSYSWYYGEVMLNYGITSTIDVGNSGEVAIAHRDAVHAGHLRAIDTVIMNGKVVERGYDIGYHDPYRRNSELNPPVEALPWVVALRDASFNQRGFRYVGRPPGDPVTLIGNPDRRPDHYSMWVEGVIFADGTEVDVRNNP